MLNKSPRQFKPKRKGLLRLFNRFLLVCACVLSLSYIATINDLSIKGFVMDELEERHKQLCKDNQSLEIEATRLESYENILKRAASLKMVKVDNIEYVNAANGPVAKK